MFVIPLICQPLACQPIDLCREKFEHLSSLDLADLTGANLTVANLRGASLVQTVLDDTNMIKVRGLTQDQLDRACGERIKGLPRPFRVKPCPGESD